MKKLLLPLVLLLSSMMLFATFTKKDEQSFKIIGYKINPESDFLNIFIVSALAPYDNIGNNAEIKLGDSLYNYIFNTAKIENHDSQLIFSVRVVGNTLKKYELDVEFEPFINKEKRGDALTRQLTPEAINAIDATSKIDAHFEVGVYKFSYVNEKIQTTDTEVLNVPNKEVSFNDGVANSNKMTFSWQAADHKNENNNTQPTWSARAAILLAISSGDYASAVNGTYSSYVKVTLKENS